MWGALSGRDAKPLLEGGDCIGRPAHASLRRGAELHRTRELAARDPVIDRTQRHAEPLGDLALGDVVHKRSAK